MSGFSPVTYALARKAARAYTDELFSKVDSVSIAFVDALPTVDIKEKTIYFVPRNESEFDYVYNEFMYINNEWKQVGSTELHLEDYYTKNELKEELTNILPYATKTNTGGIKIDGKTVVVNEDGILSVNFDTKEEGSVQDIVQDQIDENLGSISDGDIGSLFDF